MPAKIQLDKVGRAYATPSGPLPVIDGISLTVGEGEFLAIVGPSGCGKTTLLNIMAGFDAPDAGSVRIDGVPLAGPGPKGVVIWQQGSVFPWLTVQRNLMFGLRGQDGEKRATADRYAERVGLRGFERAYPHELSGGMLKRVELARALALKPSILYMDEPLAALDALTALRMRSEIARILAEERHTCVLVTHDVEEAVELAARVVVLSPRPARIQAVFEVPREGIRDPANPTAARLKAAILRELGI